MTGPSRKLLLVVTTVFLATSLVVPIPGVGQASSQDKAKACNSAADTKGLKGDDRKNFMQDCLNKAGAQKPSEMSQQDKMNTCKNLADKKNLTGTDRKSFIKDCMNKANPN
jgi:psiF repeat